ncbi:DNA polymerase epsilon catalytic subunit, partial [Coemansia sp. RSA 1591]
MGDRESAVFGLPSTRGRGRGKPYQSRQQPDASALSTHFPAAALDAEQSRLDMRLDKARTDDEIDSKLGFPRFQEGAQRLGWLINMHATSVMNSDKQVEQSA